MRPVVAFVCLGLLFLFGFFERSAQSPGPARIIRTVPESYAFDEYAVPVVRESVAERQVYPYSVIRGGVRDRDELEYEIRRDPVVAEHYAGFDTSRARIVRVRDEKLVHVSYRIGNRIFWTAKKVKLAQGEALVSDGKQLARARCGNRVSVDPQQPTFAAEPAPEVFITPVIPVDLGPIETETISPQPLDLVAEIGTPMPDITPPALTTMEDSYFYEEFLPYTPVERFVPQYYMHPPEYPGVPEPATWILLASGLASFAFLRRLRGKK